MNATTTRRYRDLPDDAPATAFAPAPVGAYRRGWEDRHYDRCWFCPYAAGTVEAGEYAAGSGRRGNLSERRSKTMNNEVTDQDVAEADKLYRQWVTAIEVNPASLRELTDKFYIAHRQYCAASAKLDAVPIEAIALLLWGDATAFGYVEACSMVGNWLVSVSDLTPLEVPA